MSAARWIALVLIVAACMSTRFLQLPNIAAIGAMTVFCGAMLPQRRWAVAIPLVAIFISDCFLGLYSLLPVVYASHAFNVLLGRWIARRGKVGTGLAATLIGSVQFFLVTNFAYFASGLYYPLTWKGFVECYAMALPFFRYSLAGDAAFAVVLFGSFALAEAAIPAIRTRSTAASSR